MQTDLFGAGRTDPRLSCIAAGSFAVAGVMMLSRSVLACLWSMMPHIQGLSVGGEQHNIASWLWSAAYMSACPMWNDAVLIIDINSTSLHPSCPVMHSAMYAVLPVNMTNCSGFLDNDECMLVMLCSRYCTINPQKRSWNSVASILNTHAAAAAQLQEKFKAATVGSCSSSSACMTPRSSVAKPHITRPYAGSPGSSSSSHVHASGTGVTPVGSPGLRSSRPGLEVSVHVAPPAAAATGVGRFRSPMSPSRRSPDTTSSRGQQGSDLQRDGGNSSTHQHSLSPAPGNACMARKLQLPFHGDGGGSGGGGMTIADGDDDSSSDEADGAMSVCTFDSDSEVNMFVDSMRHQQVCLAGTDFQSPRRKAAHAS